MVFGDTLKSVASAIFAETPSVVSKRAKEFFVQTSKEALIQTLSVRSPFLGQLAQTISDSLEKKSGTASKVSALMNTNEDFKKASEVLFKDQKDPKKIEDLLTKIFISIEKSKEKNPETYKNSETYSVFGKLFEKASESSTTNNNTTKESTSSTSKTRDSIFSKIEANTSEIYKRITELKDKILEGFTDSPKKSSNPSGPISPNQAPIAPKKFVSVKESFKGNLMSSAMSELTQNSLIGNGSNPLVGLARIVTSTLDTALRETVKDKISAFFSKDKQVEDITSTAKNNVMSEFSSNDNEKTTKSIFETVKEVQKQNLQILEKQSTNDSTSNNMDTKSMSDSSMVTSKDTNTVILQDIKKTLEENNKNDSSLETSKEESRVDNEKHHKHISILESIHKVLKDKDSTKAESSSMIVDILKTLFLGKLLAKVPMVGALLGAGSLGAGALAAGGALLSKAKGFLGPKAPGVIPTKPSMLTTVGRGLASVATPIVATIGKLAGYIPQAGEAVAKAVPAITSSSGALAKATSGVMAAGGSVLGKVGTGAVGMLAKVATPLTVGLGIFDGASKYSDVAAQEEAGQITKEQAREQKGSAVGAATGGTGGAILGGVLGSIAGPIGTVAGAVVGEKVGSFLGDKVGGLVGSAVNFFSGDDKVMPDGTKKVEPGKPNLQIDNVQNLYYDSMGNVTSSGASMSYNSLIASKAVQPMKANKGNELLAMTDKKLQIESKNEANRGTQNPVVINSNTNNGSGGGKTVIIAPTSIRNNESTFERVQMQDFWSRSS